MTREQGWWTAATILGLTALLVARSPRMIGPTPPLPIGIGWVDSDAPRRIRDLAAPIEAVANWPGLGHYLAAVAWTESRGNSSVCQGDCGPNSARGWFQIRPKTARVADLGLSPAAIFDEPTSIALAAWYANRLRPYASPGQAVDWLAIRRGWAIPGLVDDVNEAHERSPKTRRRFDEGLAKAGMSASFKHTPAFPPGYQWPGIDAVLSAVGRERAA